MGYGKLRTKLTESMLAKYHRWIYETQTPETVESLKTWVFQESTFRTIASETVHGLAGDSEPVQGVMTSSPASPTWNGQSKFFGELIHVDSNHWKNTSCHLCGQSHNIWTCQKFVKNMFLVDGIPQSASNYVFVVWVTVTWEKHAKTANHVGKTDAPNCIMCSYT